ncbi:Panacea domain-containing protein [Gabonibacter massiliensis]|uniref:Panacea domain-containing protein n=1 Tax=Gabonibacter massiliensis TaxID=1720195 RepID=UPI000B1B8918|nr:type II toxin-antitoxin system antitoxin SocA domain-containing protein [Gabonibacter massiliensis]
MDNSAYSNKKSDFKSVLSLKEINTEKYSTDTNSICENEEYYLPKEFEKKEYTFNSQKQTELVSVFDAARYILSRLKEKQCSTMKLHKLLYYCQAWAMVWEEKPIFKERIEAWANGPVVRELFLFHRGMYSISYWDLSNGNENALNNTQKETINDVIDFYGDKEAQWLIDLTHSEAPWQNARLGLKQLERGNNEITLDSMAEYYSSIK